ncbi:MAG: 7-cyano-7-deazaguanine/7-aminomethyl-7-deazaguanine transporter [Cocleimonas sp.]
MNTSTSALSTKKILLPLVLLHLVVIAASNYLVQIPVTVFGFQTTWGAFTFPIIFLATDLTIRLYGAPHARRIIFLAMVPAIIISYLLSVIFFEGNFTGFPQLSELNTFVARIAVASFLAYVIGQLLDIFVFSALRKNTGNNTNKNWWIPPAFSSVIGTLIDTIIFFVIAFYKSTDEFMANNWPEIAMVDYVFKLVVSLLIFVPIYGVLMNSFSKKLS